MNLSGWNQRYRSGERAAEDLEAAPVPLLIDAVKGQEPGSALDLACGTGRNALWLASHGWAVTAVDGSAAAIEILDARAAACALSVETRVADLEQGGYSIAPSRWDLIAMCYYLQRDLFEPAKQGLVPGGTLLAIVHLTEEGEEATAHRLRPGELKEFLADWPILHYYEGRPADRAHRRCVAEIVARKPVL